jgi:hypothetical protein
LCKRKGNKWGWAPRLPPKILASIYKGAVAGPGSSGSEGARAYVPAYIVRAPSRGAQTPRWGCEWFPDGTHNHGTHKRGAHAFAPHAPAHAWGAHVCAPHGRVGRTRVPLGSPLTLTCSISLISLKKKSFLLPFAPSVPFLIFFQSLLGTHILFYPNEKK